MEEKKKVNYKGLYHELLEKYDEMHNHLTSQFTEACNENDKLKNANDALKKEIATLRQTIGGYITQSTKAKNEIALLKDDYEAAKKTINDLTKVSLENKAIVKDCTIKVQELEETHRQELNEWKHKATALEDELLNQKTMTKEAERTVVFYKENYEYFKNLPWYKRLFVK